MFCQGGHFREPPRQTTRTRCSQRALVLEQHVRLRWRCSIRKHPPLHRRHNAAQGRILRSRPWDEPLDQPDHTASVQSFLTQRLVLARQRRCACDGTGQPTVRRCQRHWHSTAVPGVLRTLSTRKHHSAPLIPSVPASTTQHLYVLSVALCTRSTDSAQQSPAAHL
jgi:hypothetical protein